MYLRRRLNFAGNWFVLDVFGECPALHVHTARAHIHMYWYGYLYAGDYPAMIAAVGACIDAVFSTTEARQVWDGTARRIYRM